MSGSSTCGFRLQIRDCENKSGTIYYAFTIIDQDTGLWWRFHQRYSQLSDLHEQLLKCKKKAPFESVQIPPFPAKKWWAVQDNNFITQRKRELQDYFDIILSQPEALNMKPMEKLSLLEGGGGKGNVDSVPQKTSASYTAQAYAGEERMSSRYDEDLFGDRQSSSLWDSQLGGGGMNGKVAAKQSNLFPSLLSDDDAQTIRKSFDAQSESENNSSLMQFLASPTSQVFRPLQQSILLQNQEEHYALESSAETDPAADDLYDSKNYKEKCYESQSGLCIGGGGGGGCKCCSANSLVNVYQKSVESYRMVEQRYKQQIEQIIEQTEHSSVIEKDLFLDDDDDEEEEEEKEEEEQKLNDIIASYDEYDDIVEQYSNKSPQNIHIRQQKPKINSNQSGSSRGSGFCNQSKNSSCHRDSVFSVSRCNSTQTEFDDEDERKRGDHLNSNILDELNLNEREQQDNEEVTERSDKDEID